MTKMPQDADRYPIPALALRDDGAHAITAAATPARNTNAFNEDTRVVFLYATVPIYIKFGDELVEAAATDHYFPAGIYYGFSIGGGKVGHKTHLSVLQVSGGGTVYVSEAA